MFSKLDLFKKSISLNFQGQSTISTITGKVLSIFIFAYIIFSCITSEMIQKINPNTLTQEIKPENRGKFFFSNENFTFTIGLFDDINGFVIDSSIFSFSSQINFFDSTVKDNFSHVKTEKLVPCKETYYLKRKHLFENFYFNNTFCLPENLSNFEISGYFDEPTTNFISFSLDRCVNTSENNFSCRSREEIDSFFDGKFISFVLEDNFIDASDYKNPIKYHFRELSKVLDRKIAKSINLYVKDKNILIDDGFFFQEKRLLGTFSVDNIDLDYYSYNLKNWDTPVSKIYIFSGEIKIIITSRYQHVQDLLAQIGGVLNVLILVGFVLSSIEYNYLIVKKLSSDLYVYQNNIAKINKKKKSDNLKKIDNITVTDNIYGEQNEQTSKLIFSERKNHFKNTNMNSTKDKDFDIQLVEKNQIQETIKIPMVNRMKLKQKYLPSDKSIMIKSLSSEEIVKRKKEVNFSRNSLIMKANSNRTESSPKEKNKKNRRKFMKKMLSIFKSKEIHKLDLNKFIDLNKRESNFPINFFSYLKTLLKMKSFKLNYKEKLFLKGEKEIMNELDIGMIIKKMNDIEKLKKILLNKKQLFIFNCLSNPLIYLDDEKQKNNEENLKNSQGIFKLDRRKPIQKEKLRKFYFEIKENSGKSEINKRMIDLFDNEVLSKIDKIN